MRTFIARGIFPSWLFRYLCTCTIHDRSLASCGHPPLVILLPLGGRRRQPAFEADSFPWGIIGGVGGPGRHELRQRRQGSVRVEAGEGARGRRARPPLHVLGEPEAAQAALLGDGHAVAQAAPEPRRRVAGFLRLRVAADGRRRRAQEVVEVRDQRDDVLEDAHRFLHNVLPLGRREQGLGLGEVLLKLEPEILPVRGSAETKEEEREFR